MTNSSTKQTIVLCFSLNYSTYSEYFIELANQLVTQYRVIIVADQVKPHPFVLNEQVEVRTWPTTSTTTRADFTFFYRLCRTEHVQLVIANFSAVNMGMLAARLAGVPNRIAWARTSFTKEERNWWGNWRKSLVYRCATLVFANSALTRSDLEQTYRVASTKIQIKPNCLRADIVEPATVDGQRILYAGRLAPIKNIPRIIGAFAQISPEFPQATLHVYGGKLGGRFMTDLQQLAQSKGVAPACHFHGDVTRDELLRAFSTGYVGFFPSLVEAFGNVVIEAFSVGMPAIVSRGTGMVEIVQDGINGLYCDPLDEKDMADQLRTLLANPAMRDKFGLAARERFLTTYTLEGQLELLVQQIRELCA